VKAWCFFHFGHSNGESGLRQEQVSIRCQTLREAATERH
jgi:hypothetical protein